MYELAFFERFICFYWAERQVSFGYHQQMILQGEASCSFSQRYYTRVPSWRAELPLLDLDNGKCGVYECFLFVLFCFVFLYSLIGYHSDILNN